MTLPIIVHFTIFVAPTLRNLTHVFIAVVYVAQPASAVGLLLLFVLSLLFVGLSLLLVELLFLGYLGLGSFGLLDVFQNFWTLRIERLLEFDV